MRIYCDGIELSVENGGYARRHDSSRIPGEMRAVVRLTLNDGTKSIDVLLRDSEREQLINELRFGDVVRVPPEYNEVRNEMIKGQLQNG
jgi:hypothetical protein